MKRAAWLKGLAIRSPERREDETGSAEIREIPVEAIVFSRYQPRCDAGDGLEDLCESIKANGLIQPVVVRRAGAGYELVAGERRVRACRMAGVATVAAVVREYSDREAALAALVENVQRAGLHPLDEAEGYRRLAEEFHLTQGEVARAVGLSQPAVANKIRLLRLPEAVKAALRAGAISERHGRALLRLDGQESQVKALETIVRRGLSVEQAEALIESEVTLSSGAVRKPARVRVRIFKDVRLFVNSFREAVQALRKAGIHATLEERESENELEMTMRIPKTARLRRRVANGGRMGGGTI